MNNREKILMALLTIATIAMIGLAGALIAMSQENGKYRTILDIACQKSYSPKQCKAGIDLLMEMGPDKIKESGLFGI